MAPFRDPTPVFHITAIDNLKSIAQSGALLSKNVAIAKGLVTANIAYDEVQGRRATKVVPVAPGGVLHDYVPFYFAPRSPMLMTINSGNVSGCDYRQDDIVHLVSQAQIIRNGGHPFAFTDLHAVKTFAAFFNDLNHLDKIDWRIFFETPLLEGFCKFWNSRHDPTHHIRRQESRMAEFLVHQQLPISAISEIGVRTPQGEARIRDALTGTGWNPTLRVVTGWYF